HGTASGPGRQVADDGGRRLQPDGRLAGSPRARQRPPARVAGDRDRRPARTRARGGDGTSGVRSGTRGRGAAAMTTPMTRRESRERPGARQPDAGRLTGRGGVLVMFAACFAGLLVAKWANWGELADAVFFMASSLTAYYVRPGCLLPVVVSPPLLFFFACAIQQALTSSGILETLSGTVVALANSAGWLFAGTGLTIAIGLMRGLSSEVRALIVALRSLLLARLALRARLAYLRSSRGSWNVMRSLTASTSSTCSNPRAASL